jgi:protein ImuB
LDTLGAFAELPERNVLGRLGADGVACHRVARGVDGELPGQRVTDVNLTLAALDDTALPTTTQEDFWAGREDGRRAARVLAALQGWLGADAVQVLCRRGGRSPDDQMRWVTWSPVDTLVPMTPAPWPGHLPSPAPALVHRQPLAVELSGREGPVVVTGAGELTGDPVRLSVAGDRWAPVVGWAGPWLASERWWQPGWRRAVHLQVVTAGPAYLLRLERGSWRLVATYD